MKMTLAIRLLAAFPALLAVLMFLVVDLGFQVLRFPGAPPEAYMAIEIGLLLGVTFVAITVFMFRWATAIAQAPDGPWKEIR